jgi:hypothetical protein
MPRSESSLSFNHQSIRDQGVPVLTLKTLRFALCVISLLPTISLANAISEIGPTEYSNKAKELSAACKAKGRPNFTGFCVSREYGVVSYNDPIQTSITVGLEIASFERFYSNCEHSDFASVSNVLAKAKAVLEAQRFFDEMKNQEEALSNYVGRFYFCGDKSKNDMAISKRLQWFEYMIGKYSGERK